MGEMDANENVFSVCENYCANHKSLIQFSLIQFSESIIIYLLGQHFIDYHMF